MWHVGHRAGLPHGRIMAGMGELSQSSWTEAMRRTVLEGAERRDSLSDSIAARPELFSGFEAALLSLGEEAGGLEGILEMLGRWFEGESRRTQWVKKKMAYPMVNALAAIFIVPFPILFFGDAIQYLTIVGVETAAALLFGGAFVRWVALRYRNRPKLVLARLFRGLAIALEAGLPLDRALTTASDAAADRSLDEHLRAIPPEVKHRQPLVETLDGWSGLRHEARLALATAGETGDYTSTLRKLADLYEDGF